MLYDLNILWTASISPADLTNTVSFLSELGYHTLALTHSLSATSIPSQIINPIPLPSSLTIPSKTTILRRLTLSLADPSQNHRLPALVAAYDILALRPTTEKAFLACCQSISEGSMISLDLTVRYPFHWKPKPLMTAINRGVKIEICYAQATAGSSDARRNFIGNLTGIVRATKGRGLVISSEARGVLGLRAPADVLNLLGIWGLGRERGAEAMGANARGVVVNEGIKRTGFRGVVNVIDGGERVVQEKKDAEDDVGKSKGKRKAEQEGGDATPQISKRQAKRLRVEALKAAKASSQTEDSPASSSKDATPSKDPPTPSSTDSPSSINAKANG